MKVVLLLALLGGFCSGLQPGLEYHYRYSARVATGLTHLKNQFSGAGIRADVNIQMSEDYTGLVQFTGVEVGDFHDEVNCDPRSPLPIDYHRLEHGVELLEKPFRVTANESRVIEFLDVPQEPAWITNIRKAFVNIFRFSPFGVTHHAEEVSEPRPDTLSHLDFSSFDETLMGRCTNWYSVVKLPEEDAAIYDRDHDLEDDIQREHSSSSGSYTGGAKGRGGGAKGRKGSKGGHGAAKGRKGAKTTPSRLTAGVPALDDTLWKVVRTQDFSDCESLVSMKSHVTHTTETLFNRASTASYIVRGDLTGTRLERAMVEGAITLFTHEDHTEHFDTFTNQTVELKVVRSIRDHLTIDYEPHRFHSWRYELEHSIADHHEPGVQHTLEELLTGEMMTSAMIAEIKANIIQEIGHVSHRMPRNPSHTNSLLSEIHPIVEEVSVLSKQHLEEIYNTFKSEDSTDQKKKLYVFKQALISSGTESAYSLLLALISQRETQVNFPGIVDGFFQHMHGVINDPSSILKIMEVVMHMSWDEFGELTKSTGLISFSEMAGKMCFSPDKRSRHWDNTCESEHICDTQTIINTYIPYLQQGLENDESSNTQRFVYLKALTLLRTPMTFEILRPYILGSKTQYLSFRKEAIMSLRKSDMPTTAVGQVFDLLMPIFENIAEHHEARSLAFLVMASWETSTSWWHRMALASWHDPSHKVANFISTTIKATAHLEHRSKIADAASRVEHLVKPAAPASISHSVNHYLIDHLETHEIRHPVEFAWLANTESFLPSEMVFRFPFLNYLGVFDSFKINIEHYRGWEYLIRLLSNVYGPDPSKISQDAIEIVMGMYNEMKEKLDFHPIDSDPTEVLFVHLERRLIAFLNDRRGADPIQQIATGIGNPVLNVPHFNRIRESYVALPTDIGLPFVARNVVEEADWIEFEFVPGAALSKGSTKLTVDCGTYLYTETKTLTPWSTEKSAVGSGYKEDSSLLLPLALHHNINMRSYEVQLNVEPLTDDKVHLLHFESKPFTAQHGGFPAIVHHPGDDYKYIHKYETCSYHDQVQVFPSVAGLWVQAEYKGDIPDPLLELLHPFNLVEAKIDVVRPIVQSWEASVVYDPEASTTKSVSLTGTFVSTDKTSGFGEVSGEIETLGQESQSSADYADYSQFSQSSSSDYQQLGGVEESIPVQSATRQRIARMQEQVVPATGGHVRSISLDFDLNGTPSRKYAAVFTWATGASTTKRNTKLQFTWIQDVPEGVLDEPHSTCLNVQFVKPEFLPFASPDQVLNADFHSTLKIDVHDGVTCDLPAVLEIEGNIDLSPEQLNEARRKMSEHCGTDTVLHPIDFITSPVYDHMQFKAHWTEEFPIQLKNSTYHLYDLIRGLKFPDIHFDYTVTNTDHEIEMDATKCHETQEWSIHVTKPHEVYIIDHVKTPYLFDVIVGSPARISETLIYDFLNGREHHACVITHEKVHTYDGLEFPYHPDECWNVVSMDVTHHETGSVEVRLHDGHWELRILLPREGLLLEMTKTTFKVNGEDFRGNDDRFEVFHVEDGMILDIHFVTDNIFKVSDNIYVLENHVFKGKVRGLCGNYDGETTAEMVGPKGCVYTDPELFIKSWTTPGEGCSGFGFLAKKKPVEDYQGACPQASHPPTGVAYPATVQNDCLTWTYQERTEGTRKCKALLPTLQCQSHCHAVRERSTPIMYDCEETDEASHSPKCILQELPTSFPSNCVHH